MQLRVTTEGSWGLDESAMAYLNSPRNFRNRADAYACAYTLLDSEREIDGEKWECVDYTDVAGEDSSYGVLLAIWAKVTPSK